MNDRQKFLDFLQARGASATCSSCGKNNWNVPTDQSLTLALPINQSGTFSMPPPSVPVRILICGNCGFVRMHAVGAVDPEALRGM
ncbi:hypothetical protein [Sphingobium fuliginis]|uniref:hypothetical protein n=1 Tax=Sphingobium fuliginis (strain ATCC 27551) TaxID=336203 RepID=UPI0037C5E3A9